MIARSHQELISLLHFRSGLKIIFTNGCYDVAHRGHIEFLSWCRAQILPSDYLVVALNSDASVARLKPGRPINMLDDRMAVIDALRCVDLVTSFDEDTPLEIIKIIKPDILAKGGDYAGKAIVGADVVEQYGGRVIFGPYLEGYSTTNILSRI